MTWIELNEECWRKYLFRVSWLLRHFYCLKSSSIHSLLAGVDWVDSESVFVWMWQQILTHSDRVVFFNQSLSVWGCHYLTANCPSWAMVERQYKWTYLHIQLALTHLVGNHIESLKHQVQVFYPLESQVNRGLCKNSSMNSMCYIFPPSS